MRGVVVAMRGGIENGLASPIARELGDDALRDQQRAGLVMWIPVGVVMMAIGLAILAAWLGQSARASSGSAYPALRGDA